MSSFALTYPHLRFATVGKADKYRRHQTICFSHEYFTQGGCDSHRERILFNIDISIFFRLQYANSTTVFSSYLRCSERASAIYIKFREISLNWMNIFFFKLSAPDQVPPHLDSGTTSKTLLSSISHSVSAGTFRDILSLCIQLLSSNVTRSVFFNC